VQVELENNINAKRAKPGSKVKAKTVSPLTLANGKVIPLASEIYGRVTEVTNDAGGSSLAIAFDQLEIRNKKIPLEFSIRAALGPGPGSDNMPGGVRPDDVAEPKICGGIRDLGQTTATPTPYGAISKTRITDDSGQVVASDGSVVGMPGVTLQVDDGPRHTSNFTSRSRNLQLNEGLDLMLALVE
jgi:hypothetical protein